MRIRIPVATLAVLVAAAASSPAAAAEEGSVNVRLDITVSERAPDGSSSERSLELLALAGQRARVSTGWRVPIPVTTFDSGEGEAGAARPVTSYQYQEVGVTVRVEPRLLGEGRVRVSGQAEISSLGAASNAEAPSSPRIGAFNLVFDAALADGVRTALATLPSPDGGELRIFFTASVQD